MPHLMLNSNAGLVKAMLLKCTATGAKGRSLNRTGSVAVVAVQSFIVHWEKGSTKQRQRGLSDETTFQEIQPRTTTGMFYPRARHYFLALSPFPFMSTTGPPLHVTTQSQSLPLELDVSVPARALWVSPMNYQCRQYSSKKSKSKKKAAARRDQDTDDEDDDEDEEKDGDDGDFEVGSEMADEKRSWKDLKMNVPSTRVDAVLSAGLGVSRKKVEEAFLSAKLRHNGKKVLKKSRQVQEGDTVDLVKEARAPREGGEEVTVVMRVEVRRIAGEKTASERTPVVLRRWKHLELPREKTS